MMNSKPAMSAQQLQCYLHDQIPLSRTMQVSCISVTADEVMLQAPLEPNINHHATVFGGSASALAILAGWSLVCVHLHAAQARCDLVIQRNTMDYLLPIRGVFSAAAKLLEPQEWPRVLRMLERRGVARTAVAAELIYAGKVAGRFLGEFAALAREGAKVPGVCPGT
jgi:thioesterase domain-containing protein